MAFHKDNSKYVYIALEAFQQTIDTKLLQESAERYAQLYEEDLAITELAEAALSEWPE